MENYLSLDIGSSNIKFAEGNFNRSSLTIAKTSTLQVPDYSIENEQIKNSDELADKIREHLIKENYKAKEIILTLNASASVIRELDLPKASPKELDSMIKNEMMLTYHIGETNKIQYKMVGSYTDDAGAIINKFRVGAMEEGFVEAYYHFAKKIQLKPIAMDINMNATDKFIGLSPTINDVSLVDKAVMVVDLGASLTSIYIYNSGRQYIFRRLNIGSSEIERIVSDLTLSSPASIKKLKEEGFNFFEQTDFKYEQYTTALKPYFYSLTEELRNIIRFYANRFVSSSVVQVFLTGGGSKLHGLPEYLTTNLYIPVERIKKAVHINHDADEEEFSSYTNAFGALIRY